MYLIVQEVTSRLGPERGYGNGSRKLAGEAIQIEGAAHVKVPRWQGFRHRETKRA